MYWSKGKVIQHRVSMSNGGRYSPCLYDVPNIISSSRDRVTSTENAGLILFLSNLKFYNKEQMEQIQYKCNKYIYENWSNY